MLTRYLMHLLSPFFRWWWAAITGIFTILGVLWTPIGGVTLGRGTLSVLIFVVSISLFLVFSFAVVSWRWFTKTSNHPVIVDIIRQQGRQTPLTFVIQAGDEAIPTGSLVAVFRRNEYDVEVCAAILEVKSARTDGKGFQAEPKWITSLNKTLFQKNQVRRTDIELRVVDAQALALVEKCSREE